MSDPKEYYKALKVTPTATHDEIRKSYLKMASHYHPDKFVDKNEKEIAHNKFIKIGEAYEILSDEKKRKQYDKYGNISDNNIYDMNREFNHQNIFKYFDKIFERHMKIFNHGFNGTNIMHDFDRMHKNFLKYSHDDHDSFRGYSKLQETIIVNGKPKTIIKEMINKNGVVTEKITKIDETGHKTENKKIIDHTHKSNVKRIENKN
jgi:DnaJ-class molecular chaperone